MQLNDRKNITGVTVVDWFRADGFMLWDLVFETEMPEKGFGVYFFEIFEVLPDRGRQRQAFERLFADEFIVLDVVVSQGERLGAVVILIVLVGIAFGGIV